MCSEQCPWPRCSEQCPWPRCSEQCPWPRCSEQCTWPRCGEQCTWPRCSEQCTWLSCLQLLAPSDAAFEELQGQLGGGRVLPLALLLQLPELDDIIKYHIVPGRFSTSECHIMSPAAAA